MPARNNYGLLLIVTISFFIGLIVAIYPFTFNFKLVRPELVCLLVIFWALYGNIEFGIVSAWMLGLLQDLVEGLTWGSHALALSVVTFICLSSYKRFNNFSVWHQTLWVFILVGLHQVIVNWINGLASYQNSVLHLLIPSLVSALCWPLMSISLLKLTRAYRM